MPHSTQASPTPLQPHPHSHPGTDACQVVGSPPLCARRRPLTGRILESWDEPGRIFYLFALVTYVRSCFERLGAQLARRSRDCGLAVLCCMRPRVLRWSFMCNKFISLCVQHDASVSTCFLGGWGVVVANDLSLEAFERSHTHKCHTEI